MMFNLENLVRENIKQLIPYSSARKEFSGNATVFLDANENSFGSPIGKYHRYPDPLQNEIKSKSADLQGVNPSEIFIGNGSDEAIDLLIRIFCEPKTDNIVICPPTYGMYQVSAEINDVKVKRANLTENFQLDIKKIAETTDENTKLLFVCSPNNPTGNSLNRRDILNLTASFNGIVVIDEAYIHFSREDSFVREIGNFPNLVVLQTFSKAWGLAGLRVGLAFSNPEIINLFNKIKPPYNISQIAQESVLQALENKSIVDNNTSAIIFEREKLINQLKELRIITRIYPTDANFILAKTFDANLIYRHLADQKIIVRNRTNVELCEGCLRITVGTAEENTALIEALKKL